MEDRLKTLMHDLGNAINDSLSESDRIAEAIGEIRHAGFDVFLVLEATIGFNRREEKKTVPEESALQKVAVAKTRFTTQDHRFLKALKIAVQGRAVDGSVQLVIHSPRFLGGPLPRE